MMRTARLTRRGFLRLAVALPLVVLAVAAVVRGAAGEATASMVRAMVAYAGVAVWGWRISSSLPPADGLTEAQFGPPLYVTLSLAVLGGMAVMQEQGVTRPIGAVEAPPAAKRRAARRGVCLSGTHSVGVRRLGRAERRDGRNEARVVTAPALADLQALASRLRQAGPRYTSYPSVPFWRTDVGDAGYRAALAELAANQDDPPIAVYVHLPFCLTRCSYCGCHAVVNRQPTAPDRYLDHVAIEIDRVASLVGPRRRVTQMHWGGGTPNFLSDTQLRRLAALIGGAFDLTPDAEISLEMDPRAAHPEQAGLLRELGFNRVSLGVQDLDPSVQEAIGRRLHPRRRPFDCSNNAGRQLSPASTSIWSTGCRSRLRRRSSARSSASSSWRRTGLRRSATPTCRTCAESTRHRRVGAPGGG